MKNLAEGVMHVIYVIYVILQLSENLTEWVIHVLYVIYVRGKIFVVVPQIGPDLRCLQL